MTAKQKNYAVPKTQIIHKVETQIETVAVIEDFIGLKKRYVIGQFLVGFFRGNGKESQASK